MAYTKVVLMNLNNGRVEKAPVGFKWTMMFLSFFRYSSATVERGPSSKFY